MASSTKFTSILSHARVSTPGNHGRVRLRERDIFTDHGYLMSSPLSTQPMQTPDELAELRNQAVAEIISSERTYQQQLDMIKQHFAQPLQEQSIISPANYCLLFGHIEMIQNLSAQFMHELETNQQKLEKAFSLMTPFFKLYSVYAFDYQNALFLLQDLEVKNAAFRKFLKQAEMHPNVQRKLNSLMITPIQRVPRYKLLLEKVLLYTSPAQPEYKALKNCAIEVEIIVGHINSCINDHELMQQLLNIQNSLKDRRPNIVRPARKVVLEGVLEQIRYRGDAKSRYCILFNDIFMYCKILKTRAPNCIVENSLQSICIMPLKKCYVFEMFTENFKLACPGHGVIFGGKDKETAQWIGTLRDAIDKQKNACKTLRKDSSKRRPVRKRELNSYDSEHVLPAKRRKRNIKLENPKDKTFIAGPMKSQNWFKRVVNFLRNFV